MPKEPKHHYIPEFYSRQWCGANDKLIEYCRRHKGVEARPTAPGGTGYIRGLYRLPDAPPSEQYLVETKIMSAVDNWASRALEKLKAPSTEVGKLQPREGLGWLQFIYSLVVRNPEQLLLIKQRLKDLDPGEVLEALRDRYPQIRTPNYPKTFEEYKEHVIRNPIDVPAPHALPFLMKSKAVVNALGSLKWRTATLRLAKYPLLTSDRPIVMSNGFGHPDAFLMLPIGPRLLLIGTKQETTFQAVTSMDPKALGEMMNDRVCQQAYKFVYGSDDRQLRFVAKRLGKRIWSSPLDLRQT